MTTHRDVAVRLAHGACLLSQGELPPPAQYEVWVHDITYHTSIHENVRKRFIYGFHYDAQDSPRTSCR